MTTLHDIPTTTPSPSPKASAAQAIRLVAEREIAVVRKAFDWSERECFMRELPVDQGPGNILLLEAKFEHVTEIVSGFAQLGVTAERVAKTAVGRMRGYMGCEAFAGPYLADQLLLPMALAGRRVHHPAA